MWSRAVAESYWSTRKAYSMPRKESTMRYYVMDKENAKYFEKSDGSRVWHLSREDAMRISEGAVVVALDERNFNESLNCYLNGKLYAQLAYDERNGWIS